MASDFSINTLLNLPRSDESEASSSKENKHKHYSDTDLPDFAHSEEEENLPCSSSSRQDLASKDPSKILDSSPCSLENRFSAEYTTIVIPRKEAKPRRKRTAFSNIQLYFLEQFFQKKAYPSSHERNFIASILSIGSGQVKTWFQNRRTKWKKSNFADFEKQTFVETSGFQGNPSWPICNQVLWSPGFPAPVMGNGNCQVSYYH